MLLSVRLSVRSIRTVPDTPQISELLVTAAVPPFTKSPRAWKSFAHLGSLISGTEGAPKRGSPGAIGAKGIFAPGQPAATLTIAATGAFSLIPANVKGAPFSLRLV